MTVLRSWFEPRLSAQSSCSQWFRVWPSDIDAFGHMNNGRYLQIMDVARMRWLLRTGTIGAIRRQSWSVVLGGNLIRYRRSLRLLFRYRVSTRLLCWDDRWFFLEHAFHGASGDRFAVGIPRAAFRSNGSWLSTDAVVREVENGIQSPPMPAYLATWLNVEEAAFASAHDPATLEA